MLHSRIKSATDSVKCVICISGALKRMLNLNVPFSKSSLAEPQWKVRRINKQLLLFTPLSYCDLTDSNE